MGSDQDSGLPTPSIQNHQPGLKNKNNRDQEIEKKINMHLEFFLFAFSVLHCSGSCFQAFLLKTAFFLIKIIIITES